MALKIHKIVVVGLGYVGLSNAVLLAQHNYVTGVDISQDRVDALNNRQSPIADAELVDFLNTKDLKLKATTDLKPAVLGADYVIVAAPTNYDEKTNYFDTSSVEEIIQAVVEAEPKASIVVKSTVPIGFIDYVCDRFNTDRIFFSPEFLREGRALYDNLYPSRIIIGNQTDRAKIFANLLKQAAKKADIDLLFTGTREAESIKLFSNTFLAMRVAFFNELDTYAMANELHTRQIIDGVSLDPRIGDHYNNPSFGYGGYCLPKDTKQLMANYGDIPQRLISAIVDANLIRSKFLVDEIMKKKPRVIGIFRLLIKQKSDNIRQPSVEGILQLLSASDTEVVVYEPYLKQSHFHGSRVERDLERFKNSADIIVANRLSEELEDVHQKVFSRDVYRSD